MDTKTLDLPNTKPKAKVKADKEKEQKEKKIEIKGSNSGMYKVKPDSNQYTCFLATKGTGNCKLSFFDSFGRLVGNNTDWEQLKKAVKKFLGGKKVFFVHLINEKQIKQMSEHFDLVYQVNVPIGYHGGFQYHALFRAPGLKGEYARRLDDEGVTIAFPEQED